jgi:hypothetical protein
MMVMMYLCEERDDEMRRRSEKGEQGKRENGKGQT